MGTLIFAYYLRTAALAVVGCGVLRLVLRLRRSPAAERLRAVKRSLLRSGMMLAAAYVACVALMVLLENWLVFTPISAGLAWEEPHNAGIEDVWLTAADGNRIHGWWCPVAAPRCVVLYSHGKGGNLSYRQTKL